MASNREQLFTSLMNHQGVTAAERQVLIDLLNIVEELLKAHGFISDPECQPVECECRACLEAREFLLSLMHTEGLKH